MDGALGSLPFVMILTLLRVKLFVQKKSLGELPRNVIGQRLQSGRFLHFEFFMSFGVYLWLSV